MLPFELVGRLDRSARLDIRIFGYFEAASAGSSAGAGIFKEGGSEQSSRPRKP